MIWVDICPISRSIHFSVNICNIFFRWNVWSNFGSNLTVFWSFWINYFIIHFTNDIMTWNMYIIGTLDATRNGTTWHSLKAGPSWAAIKTSPNHKWTLPQTPRDLERLFLGHPSELWRALSCWTSEIRQDRCSRWATGLFLPSCIHK